MKSYFVYRLACIGFQTALILGCFIMTYGQENDYYIVKGRVVDESGKPIARAGVVVEPVVDKSTAFDSFIEGVGTDGEGSFTIKKNKNEFTIGEDQFLFVKVDTNLKALTTLRPPFEWIRRYDKTFNGKLIKFASESLIDVGDVKVQFWYGQVNLNFSEYKKRRKINNIDWSSIWIQIRNKKGYRVFASMLSQSNIEKYTNQEKAELRVSLPEGVWKVEILNDLPSPKIAESAYFVIKKDEQPKNIIVIPVRR